MTSNIFSGHFGDGRVNKNDVYYIRSVGVADTAWAAEGSKGGSISTINNQPMQLPVKFVDSLCDTKRTFVSIVPVASETMQANHGYVLAFDPATKVLTAKSKPDPINRSLDVTLTSTVSGICRPNEQYGTTPDGTRVWAANTCHGEFERGDGLSVTCGAPEGKYTECAFPADDSYIDVVTGSCFELVPGLETRADGGISIRVGWMGDPDMYLMVDVNDNALVKAAPFLDTEDFKRKATWFIKKSANDAAPVSVKILLAGTPETATPVATPTKSASFFTPFTIALIVVFGAAGALGYGLAKKLSNRTSKID